MEFFRRPFAFSAANLFPRISTRDILPKEKFIVTAFGMQWCSPLSNVVEPGMWSFRSSLMEWLSPQKNSAVNTILLPLQPIAENRNRIPFGQFGTSGYAGLDLPS